MAKTDELGPKGGKRYRCASCMSSFGIKEVHVDHIEPVIPVDTLPERPLSWDQIISNIFTDVVHLQVLCVHCHKTKTKEENKHRTTSRKQKQEDNATVPSLGSSRDNKKPKRRRKTDE